MSVASNKNASFARGEVVAPAGLWERGSEASGYIPPSGRSFPLSEAAHASACVLGLEKHRAPKAAATSPSGETRSLTRSVAQGNAFQQVGDLADSVVADIARAQAKKRAGQ